MDKPCTLIQRQMGELFQCAEVGNFVRIRTPFMYPDGDYIDLFMEEAGDVATLTDLGETIRWLKMQTITPRRSPKQNQMIEDIRLTHGVEFYRGMLQVRYKPEDNLAAAVSRLAQAALRTADLWFTFRNRTVESMTDEVADLLTERAIPFERNVTQVGRSGPSLAHQLLHPNQEAEFAGPRSEYREPRGYSSDHRACRRNLVRSEPSEGWSRGSPICLAFR